MQNCENILYYSVLLSMEKKLTTTVIPNIYFRRLIAIAFSTEIFCVKSIPILAFKQYIYTHIHNKYNFTSLYHTLTFYPCTMCCTFVLFK